MVNNILLAVQIILLAIISVILWQIWKLLNKKDDPDDQPLCKQYRKTLHTKLLFLEILIIAEAIVSIVQAILRFVLT